MVVRPHRVETGFRFLWYNGAPAVRPNGISTSGGNLSRVHLNHTIQLPEPVGRLRQLSYRMPPLPSGSRYRWKLTLFQSRDEGGVNVRRPATSSQKNVEISRWQRVNRKRNVSTIAMHRRVYGSRPSRTRHDLRAAKLYFRFQCEQFIFTATSCIAFERAYFSV